MAKINAVQRSLDQHRALRQMMGQAAATQRAR
jgi:hypothetical protein